MLAPLPAVAKPWMSTCCSVHSKMLRVCLPCVLKAVHWLTSTTVSNSVVVYLRLLTSAQIRADPDAYAPFLFHPDIGEPMEPREFCEAFVEAVGKEAGM